MQYLVSVLHTGTEVAADDEMKAIGAFNQKVRDGGHRVFAAGLELPESGIVFDNRSGEDLVAPSAKTSSEEYMAGFWIFEVSDEAEAIALATEASQVCNRRIEIRRIL